MINGCVYIMLGNVMLLKINLRELASCLQLWGNGYFIKMYENEIKFIVTF